MAVQWMYLMNHTAAAVGGILLAANSGNTGAAQAESSGLTLPQIIGVLVAVAGLIFLLVRRNMMNKKDSNTKAPQPKKEGFKVPGRDKAGNDKKEKAPAEEKTKSKSLGFKRPGDIAKKNAAPEEEKETPQGINNGLNNKYLHVDEDNQYAPNVGYTQDLRARQKQRQNPYAQAPAQNASQSQLWLTAISGPIANYAVPIPANGEITIGRGEEKTVAFPEYAGEVSHNHAKLMYVNRMLCLVDTNSVNGTFLVGTGQINPMQAYTVGEGSTFYVGCDKNGFRIVRGQ